MKHLFYLSTCSTCKRIMGELKLPADMTLQDIKHDPITPGQLDAMKELAGSYEALFSRRAVNYRALGLALKKLTESDYRSYILSDYTFLKRPVAVLNDAIFIGNGKKEVAALGAALTK